jgi:hypothetical protein
VGPGRTADPDPLGTPESDEIGGEIVDIHVDQMIRIGTVGDIPEPYLHHNSLQNVQPLTAKTYDYYWTYPYRPQQWFIPSDQSLTRPPARGHTSRPPVLHRTDGDMARFWSNACWAWS